MAVQRTSIRSKCSRGGSVKCHCCSIINVLGFRADDIPNELASWGPGIFGVVSNFTSPPAPRVTCQKPTEYPGALKKWAAKFHFWLVLFGWGVDGDKEAVGVTFILQLQVHLFFTVKKQRAGCHQIHAIWFTVSGSIKGTSGKRHDQINN